MKGIPIFPYDFGTHQRTKLVSITQPGGSLRPHQVGIGIIGSRGRNRSLIGEQHPNLVAINNRFFQHIVSFIFLKGFGLQLPLLGEQLPAFLWRKLFQINLCQFFNSTQGRIHKTGKGK